MGWIQITFLAQKHQAELLSNLLSDECGAVAVTLNEGDDEEIFEPSPGETPLWQTTQVTGMFELDASIETIVSICKAKMPEGDQLTYTVSQLGDQQWERVWLNDFKPMQFGSRLWIIPSAYSPVDQEAVNIFLDPGLAFGTGTHATTALCLEWLDLHGAHDKVVVDYGCGSGILAIAAAKLGARQVFAVDIDPQAVQATGQNARDNGVSDRINAMLVKDFEPVKADLLLANILSNPLVELESSFYGLLKPGSDIVMSGIMLNQANTVREVYLEHFNLEPKVVKEDWVMLCGTRK